MNLEELKILSFSYKNIPLRELAKLHIDDSTLGSHLSALITSGLCSEIMFLATCNRVEFIFCSSREPDAGFVAEFLTTFYAQSTEEPSILPFPAEYFTGRVKIYSGIQAVSHLLRVSSSLESLVTGEREILHQVKDAYEKCRALNCTGDTLRLVMRQAVTTAKRVFTETAISDRPVSVASIALHKLIDYGVGLNSRVVIIGAGQTAVTVSRYLKKRGFENFTIFNRTLSAAERLTAEIGGTAYPLSGLENFTAGFDVLITCCKTQKPVINYTTYSNLLNGDTGKKIIVDLSIPFAADRTLAEQFPVHFIDISSLKTSAAKNLRERKAEIESCKKIIQAGLDEFKKVFRIRKVERAMGAVPVKIKEIRQKAVDEIFSGEIAQLDTRSKEVLQQVLNYVEEKYITLPMKMAREIIVEQDETP